MYVNGLEVIFCDFFEKSTQMFGNYTPENKDET